MVVFLYTDIMFAEDEMKTFNKYIEDRENEYVLIHGSYFKKGKNISNDKKIAHVNGKFYYIKEIMDSQRSARKKATGEFNYTPIDGFWVVVSKNPIPEQLNLFP